MSCISCRRRRAASFYGRWAARVGGTEVTLLTATAYFAGVDLKPPTRVTFTDNELTLTAGDKTLSIRTGARAVLYSVGGSTRLLEHPEDAAKRTP